MVHKPLSNSQHAGWDQPAVDLYPIVVDLDDHVDPASLVRCRSNDSNDTADTKTSVYDAVASEASQRFHTERSWRTMGIEDDLFESRAEDHNSIRSFRSLPERLSPKATRRKILLPSPPSSPRRNHGPSHRHDCDEDTEWNYSKNKTNPRGNHSRIHSESNHSSVFSSLRSLLLHNKHNRKPSSGSTATSTTCSIEASLENSIRSLDSKKRGRHRRFHDEYVLTQQIARCRVATLWECVHRPSGRRYCAKAIDKRRFVSRSDRALAVRELRLCRDFLDESLKQATQHSQESSEATSSSYSASLPRIHAVFADEEASAYGWSSDPQLMLPADVAASSGSSYHSRESRDSAHHHNSHYWYIVQDFEAGGGNLALYLTQRENGMLSASDRIFTEEASQGSVSRATSKTMQEPEIRSLARFLLLTLRGLHQRSICHNNLSPDNILVPLSVAGSNTEAPSQDTGKHRHWWKQHSHQESPSLSPTDDYWKTLKLCDLGRAFVVDENPDFEPRHAPRHGSLHYTSPEVIQGDSPSLASDMWSVGIILYRCFAGELPFRGKDSEDNEDASNYSAMMDSSNSSMAASARWKLRQQLKREICRADCNLGRRKTDPRWSRVSRGAKQFLAALLHPSPSVRMTCEEALYHPWILRNGLDITTPTSSPNRSNHYHHHPRYSTPHSPRARGQNGNGEGVHYSQGNAAPITADGDQNADNLDPSDLMKPKGYVHRFLERFTIGNIIDNENMPHEC